MPGPLDFLYSLAGKYNTPTLTPEQQAAQDARAQAIQSQDPAWLQKVRSGLNTGIDFARGLTGVGDEGPPGQTPYNTGALIGAAVPFLGEAGPLRGIYSRVQRAAESLPEIVHPVKALNTIKQNASGEEIGFRKLGEFLASKGNERVPRADILAHLEQNPAPQVNVNTLQAPTGVSGYDGAGGLVYSRNDVPVNPPKYANYQLPGGTNYREHLFQTDPINPPPLKTEFRHTIIFPKSSVEDLAAPSTMYGSDSDGIYQTNTAIGGPGYGGQYAELYGGVPTHTEVIPAPDYLQPPGRQYLGPHWEEPNVFAHARVQDRPIGEPQFRPYTSEDLAHSGVRVYEDPHSGELKDFIGPDQPGYFSPEREWKFTHPDTEDTLSGYGNTREEAAQDLANYLNSSEASSGRGRLVSDAPMARNIENIQSDWHQAGAKNGYRQGDNPDLKALAMAQDVAENKAAEATKRILTNMGFQPDTDINAALAEVRTQLGHNEWELKQGRASEHTVPAINELKDYHDELTRLREERQAAYDAYGEAFNNNMNTIPDAPFKSSWLDLPLKHQILDVAKDPNLQGISVTPGEELMRRGEGHSPQFNNEKIPGALKRLLTPFGGGNPETLEIPQTKPLASWSPNLGNHGGVYTTGPQGESHWIASATGIDTDMYGNTYYQRQSPLPNPMGFLDYVNQHRITPSLRMPFFRMTPQMKEQILKKGLPLMALTGLATQPQQEEQ